MKKLLTIIAVTIAVITHFAFCVSADEENHVTVTLNGKTIDCASYGQEATIVEGRTLVPLRAIFEALGASVEWNQETKTVTSELGETEIKLTIGEKALYKNGEKVELDVPALVMNNRTLVPARAVAESFGVSVVWSAKSRTVVLMSVKNTEVNEYYLEMAGKLSEYVPKSAYDNEIIMTVDSIPVYASAARTAVMASYASSGDARFESVEIQQEMENYHRQNAALLNLGYEMGIELTQQDYDYIFANVEAMKAMYGSQYDAIFAQSPYTKYHYHLYYSIYSPIYAKITEKLLSDTNSPVALELSKRAANYLVENDYVRAKHILILFPEGEGENGEPTDAQKAETLKKANSVLKEVNAMKSESEFDALVEKYNQDPGMESNPKGYYFTKGEMVKPFEDAAYSLKEGETSGIVETTYGYHILQKLPLVDNDLFETEAYKNAYGAVVLDYFYELAQDYEIVYASNYDERVEDFKQEYRNMYP